MAVSLSFVDLLSLAIRQMEPMSMKCILEVRRSASESTLSSFSTNVEELRLQLASKN